MEFNYGLERKRFEASWKRLREQYRRAGMDDYAIDQMYEFDLDDFRRSRITAMREQPLTTDLSGDNEDMSTLFNKFFDQLTYHDCYFESPYNLERVEASSNANLYRKRCSLKTRDKALLTLYALYGYTQDEIAQITGVSFQAVSKRIKQVSTKLLPENEGRSA